MSTTSPELWSKPFFEAVDPKVIKVGSQIHKPRWSWAAIPLNPMYAFDLWYISEGEGRVHIDDQWHGFETGDLITIKLGNLFKGERTRNNPHRVTYVYLLPFGTKEHPLNRVLADVWPTKLPTRHRPEIAELFETLFNAYASDPKKNSLSIKGLAFQLLDVVFKELHRMPDENKPRAYPNLLRAKRFIETHYKDPLKLEDIVDQSGLGPSQLSAVFKHQLGCSPIEYLIRTRIREAKLLLARGELVKIVADATGFESQHYFSRMFKRKTGVTPSGFASGHVHPSRIKTQDN